jgi:hypothetical protein
MQIRSVHRPPHINRRRRRSDLHRSWEGPEGTWFPHAHTVCGLNLNDNLSVATMRAHLNTTDKLSAAPMLVGPTGLLTSKLNFFFQHLPAFRSSALQPPSPLLSRLS